MDRAVTGDTEIAPRSSNTGSASAAQRMFSISMLVSGIRCVLAYVVLPFVTPFLGLAPGVGPILGITLGAVAIAANVWSMRRFWILDHRWRKPVTAIHLAVIAFLLMLIVLDLSELLS
jgi:hypothetical protein